MRHILHLMKLKFAILVSVFLALGCLVSFGQDAKPLRVFIRAGVKTHGPNQHDHPRFLKEWTELLNQRGAKAEGAMDFPTAEQLDRTDVLILFAQDGASIKPEQKPYFEAYLNRGGGLVVVHDAVCGRDADWFKTVAGGAWDYKDAGYFEGEFAFYYQDHNHPITRGASNFDFDDEMYYDLHLMPEAHILAAAYRPDARNKVNGRNLPSVYDIVPQMWTYEKDNYRSFVCIPGHNYKTFDLPHIRAVLLRGIAWAGKRDADSLASKEELASLRYPEGGPTAPEKSAAKIVVPNDFNLNLVAAEPLIEKPISMDWDAQGRLWIAETPEYPFRKDRSRPAYDRISILEAPDANGRMHRKSVFYDGLDLVTSMVFYQDGVIVSQAPDVIWLRDTKGTGKADTRTVLYTGFGTNDTHAVISNLRWGMDGWVYATLGYTRGDIYSGDRSKHFGRLSEGVIRFKPDGSAVEQYCAKGSNTWGVDQAPDGEFFFSQANGNHIDHVVMPENALARGRVGRTTGFQNIEDHTRSFPLMSWTKQAYRQIDWVGNFTAAAGACIYDGGAWPAKYDYTYYVTEPTINLVHQDILKPTGVTFTASKSAETEGKEFIGSTDLWFRPIHERIGPDGAMYVLDFYNQAAVHNDTRGPKHDPQSNAAIRPDRDHYFGRIWRVQNKEARTLPAVNLTKATILEKVKTLEHPNKWARLTAQRLIVEGKLTAAIPALLVLAENEQAPAFGRIHALWTLEQLGALKQPQAATALGKALRSKDSVVARNALAIAALQNDAPASRSKYEQAMIERINDASPRVRLEALLALQEVATSPEIVSAVTKAYPELKDQWLQSAAVGVAARAPMEFLSAALAASQTSGMDSLISALATQIAGSADGTLAGRAVVAAAAAPASANAIKLMLLETLSRETKAGEAPAWTPELKQAAQNLLASPDQSLAIAVLPLVGRWDKSGSLGAPVKTLLDQLTPKLNDATQSDEQRGRLSASLLSVRRLNPEILNLVGGLLGSGTSTALQRSVIQSLGAIAEPQVGAVLAGNYSKLPDDLKDFALNELFKRADWAMAILDAVQAGKFSLNTLGPVAISRLRTFSDSAVATRANRMIDEARGPEVKEKNALIAQLTPLVKQPGDAAKGKQLFTQNCAVCHRFNGEGKDVAPDLTGMGVHGAADLIIHIVDPNREVEPNFYAWSIETQDGETYEGVLARENRTSLLLRNSVGDKEIKISDIKHRKNTGLSLMPNGLEALGAPALRDILSYICAAELRYRVIDLRPAFTTSTDGGLFFARDNKEDSLAFRKFGIIKAEEIPFEIVNPLKTGGNNLVVLKGGEGYAKTLPQKVEVKNVGVKAARLHFLGGVGGWGYPAINDDKLPVAKVTVKYTDAQADEFTLVNGREIADWIAHDEVPGSKGVPALTSRGQVRVFTKVLKHAGVIDRIILESTDSSVAPVFVGITADLDSSAPNPSETAQAAPAPIAPFAWGSGLHVLSVGGNTSHDFGRWFDKADSATLSAGGKASVHYTEKMAEILPNLPKTEVLYLSCNQALKDPELKKGIMAFADAGHGLLLIHPALWRNWRDWPEYNRVLVGGGATSHDSYGEFEVTVTKPNHPLMDGVPTNFHLKDELYHFERDADGSEMEVLAEGKNLKTGKTWPLIWVTKHPKARIVCCTLGHDAACHDLDAYKTFLQNSLQWLGAK